MPLESAEGETKVCGRTGYRTGTSGSQGLDALPTALRGLARVNTLGHERNQPVHQRIHN